MTHDSRPGMKPRTLTVIACLLDLIAIAGIVVWLR